MLANCKQLPLLIGHPPCYSYSKYISDQVVVLKMVKQNTVEVIFA
jgi:hypothetical protein